MLTATETLVAVIEVESSTIDVQARRSGEAVIRAVLLDQELEPQDVTVIVLETPVSTDCIEYDPANLRFGPWSADKILLTDGLASILMIGVNDDQENAMNLAKRHTQRCFIGRSNTNGEGDVDSQDHALELWRVKSTLTTKIEPSDCDEYNANEVVAPRQQEDGRWLITDGASLQLFTNSRKDADSALTLATRHSKVCFISRIPGSANQPSNYVTQYWE